MKLDRRTFIKGIGGALMLPLLESSSLFAAGAQSGPPTRFLVVGNPLGMHPESFFPKEYGKDFELQRTLKSLDWIRDRLTIISHADHGMVSGHGREVSFLCGVLPVDANAFPEKNISVDQVMARHAAKDVRYPSIEATLESSIRMNWTANGVEKLPFTDPRKLFDHLFQNRTREEKAVHKELIARNASILDTMHHQFANLRRSVSKADWERIDQYQTSVRDLEETFANRMNWIDQDSPSFSIDEHYVSEVTIENRYHSIFDMVAYAFETDLTRVASIAFPNKLKYTDIDGVNRSYHGCTHNGRKEDLSDELVTIESFQIAQLSRFMKRLDSIQEPNTDGSMLDHTIVLFGSGMGYGGTHSNRNLPILVAGGGFNHLGHVDASKNGKNMPLCNLYLTLLQRFGVEREVYNTSTGTFDLSYA